MRTEAFGERRFRLPAELRANERGVGTRSSNVPPRNRFVDDIEPRSRKRFAESDRTVQGRLAASAAAVEALINAGKEDRRRPSRGCPS